DGRNDERALGPLGAVKVYKCPAQRRKAPCKHGVQGREVVGEAEVAHIPHLLNAVAPARVEHRFYGAPVVL
nr:hypothetical protein [Tanacetum cinerariifolium]